ncbi:transaldolase/EF-hand domain-containing protein [Bythopirellula goksoeyrii]|uniref:Transaldolase/EF-hand domain-containing protein n=2 Tax=Bythopirellula goksoeyrii TaxID=1400387 RepID=A0A5B9QG33_9BACT|nr:transaldolase/EF-hand domain-containing protein [Bythopirellula goksoeyrii]
MIAAALSLQFVSVGLAAAKPDDSADLFTRLDKDTDGQLNSAEISDEYSFLFRRLVRTADSNSDGQLSIEEFQQGVSAERPEKPLAKKVSAELPGSDALLLLLAWMDTNSDLTIKSDEVPANLKTLYNQIHQQLKSKDSSQFRIRQLQQQSPRFTQLALRYTQRQQIDVEVELSLLSDEQYALVERLRGKVEPGKAFSTRENAESIFSRLDRDGDGVIAIDDLPEEVKERFFGMLQRADQNGDRRVTETEFLGFQGKVSKFSEMNSNRPEVTKRIAQLFRRADRNSDGMLTRREAPRFLAARFNEIDADGDGKLSRQELSKSLELQNNVAPEMSNKSSPNRKSSSKRPKK